ncbi:MAG: hypothetical protein ABEJ57_06445 [Halobacteriaceae archaeon]
MVSWGRPVVGVLDRILYALFSGRADEQRHAVDRRTYRGTTITTSFDVYLARVYGLAWVGALLATGVAVVLVTALAGTPVVTVATILGESVPVWVPELSPVVLRWGVAVVAGVAVRRVVLGVGRQYLRWRARARRTGIERTLPGAARYLRALATGTHSDRAMLARIADQEDAYGETATSFRKVLNVAALTGSLGTGLRRVARDTPAQEALAPFLLKFREHTQQGTEAVEGYLELESRMLGRRQDRQRRAAEGFLELVAELFVVLLVLPTLLVIVLTVLGTLSPGLSQPVVTPVGTASVRALLVYGSGVLVLGVGGVAAWLVHSLRPANVAADTYDRSPGWAVVAGATRNPADAVLAFLPAGVVVAAALAGTGLRAANVVLLGYAAWAIPVGVVAVRRARLDDAKDREIKDFVHAVSGHVNLGRPLPDAVARVAEDVDLGALNDDVARLAFGLSVTARDGEDVQSAALSTFVDRVGTPLAEQTVGLLTGALAVGSDTGTVLDALQAEVGRLYHARKAFRANLLVYAAIGWTTALLVIGVLVAVNLYVLGSFDRLATVSATSGGFVLQADAVDPARDRYRFYLVGQATMLASGWFAGYASRGRYEALLHSGALVVVAYVVFTVVGAA